MQLQTQSSGLMTQKATGQNNAPGGQLAELLVSELSPQYYTLLKNSRLFGVGAAAANASAFTGGAAGTPLLGLYNPGNSGVDLVLIALRMGVRSTGTVAGALGFNFWIGNQGATAPSGTATPARNMYSGATTGSSAVAMLNTANAGAVATTFLAPSISVGTTTATPGLNVGMFVDDIKGSIIVPQGNYLAFGSYVATTAAALDFSLFWAEIPA